MSYKVTYHTCLYREVEGEEVEHEVKIIAQVYPGSAEYIPCYSRPELYDPGSPAELEILSVTDIATGASMVLTEAEEAAVAQSIGEGEGDGHPQDYRD